ASPNPALAGRTVTFTATVAPTSPVAAVPTGVVLFRVDGNLIGYAVIDTSGHAVLKVTITRSGTRRHPLFSPFGRGTHVVTAEYAGDGSFALSISPQLTLTVV
ncbi:MAG TPA: Ig-like domain-containing protein, partial [Gemmataceae bacterium]|nr:Ig-like domain-containing protein [Gemmataceae bacterium]